MVCRIEIRKGSEAVGEATKRIIWNPDTETYLLETRNNYDGIHNLCCMHDEMKENEMGSLCRIHGMMKAAYRT